MQSELKMRMLSILLMAISFLGIRVHAEELWNTTETRAWYPYCKYLADGRATADKEMIAGSFCMGTIRAAQQMGSLMCFMEGSKTGIGSSARRANNQTLMLVVLNFYEKHANFFDVQDLSFTAFVALSQAYPCDK